MCSHLYLGCLFLRVGAFLRSMAIMAMKPDDLIQFTRETYQKSASIKAWGSKKLVDSGLTEHEKKMLARLPVKNGRLLLLGLGGGREAIPLAKSGFTVTGVDYSAELVAAAKQHAKAKGVELKGLVQDLDDLRLPFSHFDVVWFSRSMYSVIPTRKRRLGMLKRIADALRPNGYVVCQFHWDPKAHPGKKNLFVRRLAALMTLGNFSYEPGDTLWGNIEFVHAFGSERELCLEFTKAGFESIDSALFEGWYGGVAWLRKRRAGAADG
jgi:SAM-dependent methyltransferase